MHINGYGVVVHINGYGVVVHINGTGYGVVVHINGYGVVVYLFLPQIKTYYLSPNLPQLDLILLAKANYFVGNCISSFTAFVKRERDVKNKPSDFFGISDIKKDYTSSTKKKVEL